MKKNMSCFMLTIATAFCAVTLVSAQTTSPLVQKLYNGEWPSQDEIQKNYDAFLEQSAIQAYMLTLPALNVIGNLISKGRSY